MHDLVIRGATIVDGTGDRPPFTGDVAVDGGVFTEVGTVDGGGHRQLDGDGLVLTPGWVDIHTHYDGQVTWDPEVTPSSWQGVTTVVMGNCGVGFAPVRPGGEAFLIELMEGVEDIPGTALHEGIDWTWESFPEYLDALDADAAGARHRRAGPARRVAGVRDGRPGARRGDPDEYDEMARLTEEALRRRCGRVLDLTHDPAPVQARPRARHRRAAGRAAGHRRCARPRRPWRVPARVRHSRAPEPSGRG